MRKLSLYFLELQRPQLPSFGRRLGSVPLEGGGRRKHRALCRLRFVEGGFGFIKSGLGPKNRLLFRSFGYVEGGFRYVEGGFCYVEGGFRYVEDGFRYGEGGFGDTPQLGAWTGFCGQFMCLVTFKRGGYVMHLKSHKITE